MKKKKYRPDIDVLRAIAVLAVVFYHAHIPYFQGGYIGVSIFFVISGYLITGIIKRKIENNSFSFLEFYENRLRRILPALLVIVSCCVFISWLTSVNNLEMRQLFSSVKRVLLTIPNIYFYKNTNYFDPAAETLPLLHTWSLGVEEQFYFIMPALLFFLYKILKGKIQIIHILWGLCILSFISSLILIQYNQKFTFYMLPTRAWELLMGSILAYTNWTPETQKNKLLCRVMGLILIGYSIFFYKNILFPGIWALPPCLGACLYIAGGKNAQKSILNCITHNKLLVFIGLISYSVYLWHWPIFVYYQNFPFRREMPLEMGLALSLLTLIIASFSWKFIENPIRHNPFFKKRFIIWPLALLSIGTLLFTVSTLSFPYGQNQKNLFIATFPSEETEFGKQHQNNIVDFVLIGDSHAAMLPPLFKELAKEHHLYGKRVQLHPKNLYKLTANKEEIKQIDTQYKTLESIYQNYSVQNIFINFRFIIYITNVDFLKNENDFIPSYYGKNPNILSYDALYLSLKDMINDAKQHGVKNIYIQIPVPEPKAFVPQSAGKLSSLFGYSKNKINYILSEKFTEYENRNKKIIEVLKKLEKEYPHVFLINILPFFENKQEQLYNVINDNISYYIDDDHLSVEGVNLISPVYKEIFKNLFTSSK